jgi:hypothetical protein
LIYRVIGSWAYREHRPGEVFEATLELDVEKRALDLGVIEIVEHSKPGIRPGSAVLPRGWQMTTQQEA